MTRPIITVTDTAVADEEGATYRHWNGLDDLGEVLQDATVVFTNFVSLPADAVVIRYGIGVDNVDLAAAAAAQVPAPPRAVTTAPCSPQVSVQGCGPTCRPRSGR